MNQNQTKMTKIEIRSLFPCMHVVVLRTCAFPASLQMQSIRRLFRRSSIPLRIGLETLLRRMSTRPRYFQNPYTITDDRSSFKIEESRDNVKKILEQFVRDIRMNVTPRRPEIENGLYTGCAGIAYAFLQLSRHKFLLADEMQEYLSLAQQYLKFSVESVRQSDRRCEPSFLLGEGGILAVGAVVAAAIGDNRTVQDLVKRYVDAGKRCKRIDFLRDGSDEFFVGRAGYLYGALWLNRELGETVVPIELMHEIARVMIQSGLSYARSCHSPCPLMYAYYGVEYLGAAHGLCAILEILIQIPGFLDSDKNTEELVRASVDYFISIETRTGNYPCALDEIGANGRSLRSEDDELIHWCHGAPGVVYLMAAAYLRWKDQRYLDACHRCGELIWQKGLLRKGPGICHGVAGNGYVFLLLYRLTSNDIHLYRAYKFAEFMNTEEFKRQARIPDSPYSLYEGLAGTVCFLADLMEPEKAAFPFQDVF